MTIATICRRELVTIDAGAALRDAALQMRAHHVGALVVTVRQAEHEQVVGLITDRDLAVEILARDLAPGDVMVGQLASRKLVSIPETAVIVREVAPKHVVVGFLDPQVMVGLVGNAQVRGVADDAESRLRRVCASLDGRPAA